jgi:cysteate synthase
VTYRSDRLAAFLGLKELWIAFNGYWPERGAMLATGSFKELEASTVLARIPEKAATLVLASAGNTAAAFAGLCSRYDIPVVIVIPGKAMYHLRSRTPYSNTVRVVAVDQGDYSDAIALSDALGGLSGFVPEGGTNNVGRRDGLGTVMLCAAEAMGGLPDYYFQAIGSGAGAIAAHEAAVRLRYQSHAGEPLPRLMLAQNATFAPVYQAWQTGHRAWAANLQDDQRFAIKRAFAPELTNRNPPYDVHGGLREALVKSSGEVFVADADAARAAMNAFHEMEGVDIEPAAGVALAALHTAVRQGLVDVQAKILLNITGGGRARLARDHPVAQNVPTLVVSRRGVWTTEIATQIANQMNPRSRGKVSNTL